MVVRIYFTDSALSPEAITEDSSVAQIVQGFHGSSKMLTQQDKAYCYAFSE